MGATCSCSSGGCYVVKNTSPLSRLPRLPSFRSGAVKLDNAALSEDFQLHPFATLTDQFIEASGLPKYNNFFLRLTRTSSKFA